MPQKQPAVFDVTRRKHELNRLPFCHSSEVEQSLANSGAEIQRCDSTSDRHDKEVHCAFSTSMNAS